MTAAVLLVASVAFANPNPTPNPTPKPSLAKPAKAVVVVPGTPKPDPLRLMSDVDLGTELVRLRKANERLDKAARRDVANRLHRIGYEKYRSIETNLYHTIAVLEETKRREHDLHERIRIGRGIQRIHVSISDIRRMLDLLRLYAQG